MLKFLGGHNCQKSIFVFPCDNLLLCRLPKIPLVVGHSSCYHLMKFCPVCKADNPLLESRAVGTMAEIKIMCGNEKCPKRETVWQSQPFMPDSKAAAGNILLCFSVLASGGSASKTFQIFQNMGLWCISLKTFFKHRKVRCD